MFGNTKRERTPLSPSPSPEPPEGSAERGRQGYRPASAPFQERSSDGRPAAFGSPFGSTGTSVKVESGDVVVDGGKASEEYYADPAQEAARKTLEERIRIAIDYLMQLATCAAEVHQGDEDIVRLKLNETMEALQVVQDATNLPDLRQMIPEDVMSMIDLGRNPDIHTRTFTNRLNSDNQQMRGQAQNFDHYRGRLHDKLSQAFPEMQDELRSLDQSPS